MLIILTFSRRFIYLIVIIFLVIIGSFTYIHFEKERREAFLISQLEEKVTLTKDLYNISSSSYTYMGYHYAISFTDEPNVQYDFFVKSISHDQHSIVYYGYDSEEEAPGPKRDLLFKEKINGF